MRQSDETP
nr:TPA_asm: m22.5 uORF 2 [Murid betaherpesvirus 1]DBA07738.1 TPA_asm: m22.5 uORF 2 [Murid betaherpesvirus 1]